MKMRDLSALSHQQLYAVNDNPGLHDEIRSVALAELERRQAIGKDEQELGSGPDSTTEQHKAVRLSLYLKIVLLLLPGILFIQPQLWSVGIAILSSKYLSRGYKRKWKDFWTYLCVGCLLWPVFTLLLSRFVLFSNISKG